MSLEYDVSLAVLKIAASQTNGICTFDQARQQVSNYVNIPSAELALSPTRAGEPLWHQIIRNIKSHDKAEGNFIFDGYLEHVPDIGYKITALGRNYLQNPN